MTRILTTSLFIAMTVAAVAACSGSSGSAAPSAATSQAPAAPAGGATAVTIKDFQFTPATTSVPTGSKVTWTNNDTTAHSGNLAPAATFDQTFTTAGTFAYHCTIHSQMKGTVTVTP